MYDIERQIEGNDALERWRIRQEQSQGIIEELHHWLHTHRAKVPEGSATAKAID